MLELISSDISYNMMMRTDTLFIKLVCKNSGSAILNPITAFLDMEFGHQRFLEGMPTKRRIYFDVLPVREIKSGQIFTFGIRYKGDLTWGGTYTISVGAESAKETVMEAAQIGEVDIGWGWGIPCMLRDRKPIHKAFSDCEEIQKDTVSEKPIDLHFTFFDGHEVFCQNTYELTKTEKGFLVDAGGYARFTLARTEQNGTVTYTVEDFSDGIKDGVLLLETRIKLFEKRQGKAAVFQGGGRLFDIEGAFPVGYEYKYDLRLAAMAYDKQDICIAEMHCPDDRLYAGVSDSGFCTQGIIVHRARQKERTVLVKDSHKITVTVLSKEELEGWQTAARFLRKDLKRPENQDFLTDKIYYMFHVTEGPKPPDGMVKKYSPFPIARLEAFMSLKEVAKIIKEYHNFFGGIRQMPYIGGFQKGGFDSGFICPYETDERVGTASELKQLVEESRSLYGASVGLHDNFDDNNLFELDDDVICLDETQQPWMGWFWAGGMSHIISPQKYLATGKAQQKIEKMIETYGIKDSTHLDVLTSEPLRYDFDENNPSTATDNIRAKQQLVREFNKRGLSVTSETMIHPFAGLVTCAVNSRDEHDAIYFGNDSYIPLGSMVYHGIFPNCGSGDNDYEFLWQLLKGYAGQIGEEHKKQAVLDKIYLLNLAILPFLTLQIERFEEDGDKHRAVYSDQSYIEVDFESLSYEIVFDGRLCGKNFTSMVKAPDGYILYSRDGGEVCYPLPKELENMPLTAVKLSFDGECGQAQTEISENTVSICLDAGVPVKIKKRRGD